MITIASTRTILPCCALYDRGTWSFAILTTSAIVLVLLLLSRAWQSGSLEVPAIHRQAPTEIAPMVNDLQPVDNRLDPVPRLPLDLGKPRSQVEHIIKVYTPNRAVSEVHPNTHPRVSKEDTIRVLVVTIRARVTAYTAWDHLISKPEWADGLVAWRPNGRQRDVHTHPYGVATDWSQFPPGATFIRIPGYLDTSHAEFPHNYWVVDDKCGAARQASRQGEQPVIDLRFVTRYSAIDPEQGWGARELDVEVIFPADHVIPASLRPWVVGSEWHTYRQGRLVARAPDQDESGVLLATNERTGTVGGL